jgi:YcxB-like protein
MIVQFDATLDDFVDVSMRGFARSKFTRTSRIRGLIISTMCVALIPFFMVPGGLSARLLAAVIGALAYLAISLATYKRTVEKRLRKIYRELNGTDGPVHVEVELNESGVRVSQLSIQYITDWSAIVEIEDDDDAVYFYRRDNTGLAVRNRAFESATSRSEFIQLAKCFMDTAAGQRTLIDADATNLH